MELSPKLGVEKTTWGQKVRYCFATSTDRCKTGAKSFCWRFKPQRFSWPFVQLTRHFIQMI
jgi:hypothetical protein